MYKIFFLIINFFMVAWVYLFFFKRIKDINAKHMRYTKIDWLLIWYNKLNKLILFLFILLYLVIIFITLYIY